MPNLEEIREIGKISVSVEREEQLEACLKAENIQRIYLDEASFAEEEIRCFAKKIKERGIEPALRFRRIERREDPGKTCLSWLTENEETSLFSAFLFRSLDQVSVLQRVEKRNFLSVFDYTLYSYNSSALEVWKDFRADCLTFPIELNFREDKEFSSWAKNAKLPTELLIYAHLPMMVSANCVEKTRNRCTKNNHILGLIDRQNKELSVRLYCKFCYNQIFNADVFTLFGLEKEVAALKPESLRLEFTVESKKEVEEVLRGKIGKSFTRGHFHKGIE